MINQPSRPRDDEQRGREECTEAPHEASTLKHLLKTRSRFMYYLCPRKYIYTFCVDKIQGNSISDISGTHLATKKKRHIRYTEH